MEEPREDSMSEKPRFTLQLTLRDNQSYDAPLHMAIDVDEVLRISSREVSEMRMGADFGVATMDFDAVVHLIRTKEFRRKFFVEAAQRLGALMAERMEDAEGWHDTGRIAPAREELEWPTGLIHT